MLKAGAAMFMFRPSYLCMAIFQERLATSSNTNGSFVVELLAV